jgi:hypothetical protein
MWRLRPAPCFAPRQLSEPRHTRYPAAGAAARCAVRCRLRRGAIRRSSLLNLARLPPLLLPPPPPVRRLVVVLLLLLLVMVVVVVLLAGAECISHIACRCSRHRYLIAASSPPIPPPPFSTPSLPPVRPILNWRKRCTHAARTSPGLVSALLYASHGQADLVGAGFLAAAAMVVPPPNPNPCGPRP